MGSRTTEKGEKQVKFTNRLLNCPELPTNDDSNTSFKQQTNNLSTTSVKSRGCHPTSSFLALLRLQHIMQQGGKKVDNPLKNISMCTTVNLHYMQIKREA